MRRYQVLLGAVAVGLLSLTPSEQTAAEAMSSRLSGPDRIATAAAVAQRAYGSGATTVFLARADVFSDALAAGTLNEGSVLLVPPCGDAPTPVLEAVETLDPFDVIALGGTQAVCDDLLTAVAGDRGVDRLAGADRASTRSR